MERLVQRDPSGGKPMTAMKAGTALLAGVVLAVAIVMQHDGRRGETPATAALSLDLDALARTALAARLTAEERHAAGIASPRQPPPDVTVEAEWHDASSGRLLAAVEGRKHVAPAARAAAMRRLADRIGDDPGLRRRVFRRYVATWDPEGTTLVHPLADSGAPEVVDMALDLAEHGPTHDARLAGLAILDEVDSDRADVRDRLLALLRPDEDPDVVVQALYGLERPVREGDAAARVIERTVGLLRHTDTEVRRRAYLTIAAWAATPEQATPLLHGLVEPSRTVRVAAAHALGKTQVTVPGAVEALMARVRDDDEYLLLRYHALQSLNKLALDDETRAEVAEYNGVVRGLVKPLPVALP
jgi:hypothetical protein